MKSLSVNLFDSILLTKFLVTFIIYGNSILLLKFCHKIYIDHFRNAIGSYKVIVI